MEGMLRPLSACSGNIPDLEPIPIKLGNVLLSFSYDSKIFSSVEKLVQALISCYKTIHLMCHTIVKVYSFEGGHIQIAGFNLFYC